MSEIPPMDRSQVEISTLHSQGMDSEVSTATPAERLAMVWQLTIDAWAFKEPSVVEHRFQRHVVRVIRRQG